MSERAPTESAPLNIWPYAEAALREKYPGEDTSSLDVNHVFESADGRFQHVLIGTNRSNVYLVLVINVRKRAIEGHIEVDIGKLYGVKRDA